MLVENVNAHCLQAVNEKNLREIIQDCTTDFYSKLDKMMDNSLKPSLDNYYQFNKFARRVSYNSKNIIFKTNLTRELREYSYKLCDNTVYENEENIKVSEEKKIILE